MARREWADKVARNGVQYISCITDDEVYSLIAKLLQAEHARAVRIVKRAKKLCIHPGVQHVGSLTCLAYQQACDDLLDMLTKGRA